VIFWLVMRQMYAQRDAYARRPSEDGGLSRPGPR
jgi:hypothetical protein